MGGGGGAGDGGGGGRGIADLVGWNAGGRFMGGGEGGEGLQI